MDLEFSRLRDESARVVQKYTDEIRAGNLESAINLASIEGYVPLSPWVAALRRTAVEAGLPAYCSQIWPAPDSDEVRRTLIALRYQNIETLAEFDRQWEAHHASDLEFVKSAVNAIKKHSYMLRLPYELATLVVVSWARDTVDHARDVGYADHMMAAAYGNEEQRSPA